MRYITALTIAGSDSCGGAGLQADIKTMTALGVDAASVITAITAQNTLGVNQVQTVTPDMVEAQIDAVMNDLKVDAVKIGMLNNEPTIQAVAHALSRHQPRWTVIDPVMVSTSGHALMALSAMDTFVNQLLPLASLLTPNVPEAEILSGIHIHSASDMDQAAALIAQKGGKAILIKGGHLEGVHKIDKLYIDGKLMQTFAHDSIDTKNTHGTGCTLSSAIASFLARGEELDSAVAHAVQYINGALLRNKDIIIGHGHGSVGHNPLYTTAHDDSYVKTLQHVKLQFITHCNEQHNYMEGAKLALEGGCQWIQLRMKDATDEQFIDEAKRIKALCAAYDATFIIDDRVHLAKTVGADGVHLGRNDMPIHQARTLLGYDSIIGGTANTIDDITRLHAEGADYIGCGPFRFTSTKKKLSPILGINGYRHIVQQMKQRGICLPIVAIGGILTEDVSAIIATGINGIAVSGAVLNAGNPVAEMKEFCQRLTE